MQSGDWPTGFPDPVFGSEQAFRIARIIDRWSRIEHALARILGHLLDDYEAAFIIFYSMDSMQTRANMMVQLLHRLPSHPDKEKLEKTLRDVVERYKDRHLFVHGNYLGRVDNAEIVSSKTRKGRRKSAPLLSALDKHESDLDTLWAQILPFALTDSEYPERSSIVWRIPSPGMPRA